MQRRSSILITATCLVAILSIAACAPEEMAEPESVPADVTETTVDSGESTAGTEPAATAAAGEQTLTLITHDSFNVSEEVLESFESDTGIQLRVLEGGDTGMLVNRIVLAGDNPAADVVYGIDNTFLSRALEENALESYESPLLDEIPDRFELDPQHRALPVDYGDVCLNYDTTSLEAAGVEAPTSLEDITDERYRGMTVVENPATSSPGLAFLLATIGHFGEDAYLDYWRDLVANDVEVVSDWETAYNQSFTRAGGENPIVVSYGSSPPFEVLYAEEELEEAPTAAVTADSSCFRQIEFVGILRGTENRAAAEAWVDFMLSREFQEDIPLQMFVFPVNENAELDSVFREHMDVPEETADVSSEAIAENRERWIQEWNEVVLDR